MTMSDKKKPTENTVTPAIAHHFFSPMAGIIGEKKVPSYVKPLSIENVNTLKYVMSHIQLDLQRKLALM